LGDSAGTKAGEKFAQILRFINGVPTRPGHRQAAFSRGDRMANYFMFGAIGQCPRCADHRFAGPPLLQPDATVTCHKCGLVCSVELAVTTALKAGVVKKLSDHRVVQGS
jgi:hypothetical protein